MSYPSIASLPASVRADLPTEAQQLYRTAYNTAWQRYVDYADREPFCHRLARSEVRRNFAKDKDGAWRPRPVGDCIMQEV